MRISSKLIAEAYRASKLYYEQQMGRQEAIEYLFTRGMAKGSAMIYLQVYQHLIVGDRFTRTISGESFDCFLDGIHKDSGAVQLGLALNALDKHIQYFEKSQNSTMHLVKAVYNKYLEIYSDKNFNEDTLIDDDERSFPEGKEKYQLHKSKERNNKLVQLAKDRYKQIDNTLKCQVCNFSFVEVYGEIGSGFIEAHHIFPIHMLEKETLTRMEDLALVCSNCHRMLHRKRPWISIDDLKTLRKQRI
jgi:hypothetical protein